VLLGHKYGFQPLRPRIKGDLFETLRNHLVSCGKDVSLLDEWYQRDENSVPPTYFLKSVSSLIPDFVNYDNDELREKANQKWRTLMEEMKSIFSLAAQGCLGEGKISEQEALQFRISGFFLHAPSSPLSSYLFLNLDRL